MEAGRGRGNMVEVGDQAGDDDEDEFHAFYLAEYRPLLRLAWSLTGRRDLGEELVQDSMVAAHDNWSVVSRYESPGGWARRVLLNAARSLARTRAAEVAALSRVDARSPDESEQLPDSWLWDLVRDLPARQAQAVALHYLEDRSVAEIAELLDISVATTKVHLHRGRRRLAELLAEREEGR